MKMVERTRSLLKDAILSDLQWALQDCAARPLPPADNRGLPQQSPAAAAPARERAAQASVGTERSGGEPAAAWRSFALVLEVRDSRVRELYITRPSQIRFEQRGGEEPRQARSWCQQRPLEPPQA